MTTFRFEIAALSLLLSVSHAEASHCPRGDIYRVHLQQCVSRASRLALPFEHRARPHAYPARYNQHQAEEPSHHGIVYVKVVNPNGPPLPPPPSLPQAELPFEIPPSRLNHFATIYWVVK